MDNHQNPTKVAVIGLGYVGLPVAIACASSGMQVIGFDMRADVVRGLVEGRSHVDDVDDSDVVLLRDRGAKITADPHEITSANVYVICVPTPLSEFGGPDLTHVVSAGESVSRVLGHGDLVVLESTTYPGTTEEVLIPILERSGLVAGKDFFVAYSPERIDPGNYVFGLQNTPKVVGGFTYSCRTAAVAFYQIFVDEVVPVRGLKEAEMAKLLENTYRHVNIALVNEFARVCHELSIDVWDVLEAAGTKPYGFQAFEPGPGVGGHCIPIDPNYLNHRVREKLGEPFRFIELAQEVNSSMPQYVLQRLIGMLRVKRRSVTDAQVLLLGVTYKSGIADVRESPAIDVVRLLRKVGARVEYHDPLVGEFSVDGVDVLRADSWVEAAERSDCSVLLQAHSCYGLLRRGDVNCDLLDTRGVTPRGRYERL